MNTVSPTVAPPTVSVVMPCFNAAKSIRGSVASVLGQSCRDLELLIVDDGSDDGTPSILAELQVQDGRLRLLSQRREGPSAARNKGIRAARGDFVAFLDADDLWEPETLEQLLAAIGEQPDAVLAYCGWRNWFADGRPTRTHVPPDYEADGKLEFMLAHCPWPIHAVLVRRPDLLVSGGFDETLRTSEDYDLWLRLCGARPIVRVPAVLATYVHHGGTQLSANRVRAALDHLRVQRRFIASNPSLVTHLSAGELRRMQLGRVLDCAYQAYWARDLPTSRALFRVVMRHGYGGWRDWLRMLPSWLPEWLHASLLRLFSNDTSAA